ncbi:UNVERIFIED_CONTAM: hypothetical protein HDU68_010536 [Siphonaria sp. JEL0065]|nr:hypothetical protein HDU68_010536 [Siphonaria sp. JEL0065]
MDFADSDKCSSNGAYLKSGAAFGDAILLNTMNGVVGTSSFYSTTSLKWQALVPNCISKLLFPQQPILNAQDIQCYQAIAIGSGADAGRVWLVQGSGILNTTELSGGPSGTSYLSGAISTVNCGAVKLLALVNSVYQIVMFQEYFGNLGTKSIIPITQARTAPSGSVYIPYFEPTSNTLKELIVTQSSGTFTTSVGTTLTTQDASTILEYAAYSSGLDCPYTRMLFVKLLDDSIVQSMDTGLETLESLPQTLYLDYKQSYSFNIRMAVSSSSSSDAARLGFHLSNTDAITLTYFRRVESDGEIVYTVDIFKVVVTDLGVQSQTSPGVNLKATVLKVSPIGANFGCKNLVGRAWKTKVEQSIVVYSGCSPHHTLEFIWGTDSLTKMCPEADDSIPCLWYEDAYPLEFAIHNSLSNSYKKFTGSYSLQIIGGGSSIAGIKDFSDAELLKYNPGTTATSKSLIWSDSTASEITWVCQIGSPCNGILPTDSNSTTSNYFVKFRITTLSSDFATASNSYCILTRDFNIRLYGIPVSFEASVAVTIGLTMVFVLIVVAIVAWEWNYSQKEHKRIYPVGEESEETRGSQDDAAQLLATNSIEKEKELLTKRVRLGGYQGPEKASSSHHTSILKKKKKRGGFFEFLRRRPVVRVDVDREVVGEDTLIGKKDGKSSVVKAMGTFATRESVVQKVHGKDDIKLAKQSRLMEEHIQGSIDLLEALREEKKRRE